MAKAAFLGLIAWGVASGKLRGKGIVVRELRHVSPALIDVGLVFVIFRGDVRIT